MNTSDFNRLYIEYHKQIYRYAFSILKDEPLAEDVVQDVFVKLWEMSVNTSPEEIRGLIFAMTKRKIIDLWRKQVSSRTYQKHFIANYCDLDHHTSNEIAAHDLQQQLEIALKQLTETQSRVFQMSKIEGYSYLEISEKLGISSHTVKYHLVHSMRLVKCHLKSYKGKAILVWLILFL